MPDLLAHKTPAPGPGTDTASWGRGGRRGSVTPNTFCRCQSQAAGRIRGREGEDESRVQRVHANQISAPSTPSKARVQALTPRGAPGTARRCSVTQMRTEEDSLPGDPACLTSRARDSPEHPLLADDPEVFMQLEATLGPFPRSSGHDRNPGSVSGGGTAAR